MNKIYTYNFEHTAKKIPVKITNDAFLWPEIKQAARRDNPAPTLLLKLEINKKIFNLSKQSCLTIKSGDYLSQQYIERQNAGARYFNLSDMVKKIPAQQKVQLSSNSLTWNNNAELLVFNNAVPKNAKVLVIAPHADDAELGAFGFYSSHNSYIVTITAGEDGRVDYCKMYSDNLQEQYLFKAKLRTINSITVPLYGGVKPQHAINLGYFSDTLRDMYENQDKAVISKTAGISDINVLRQLNVSNIVPENSGKATWNNLITDLTALINNIKPDVIVTPHPALDKHADHKFSTIAVFEALKNTNINHGHFFFYVIHSTLSAKYPYGPRHAPVTIPPNFEDSTEYSVYSYPLDKRQQIEKMFALNAMHDIALIPGDFSRKKSIAKRKKFYPAYDYFKKYIRANEIFLVTPFDRTVILD